jgi:hypothetical protein
MNRWTVRIAGLLMLLVFLLLFMNLQKRLMELRQQQGVTTTTSP